MTESVAVGDVNGDGVMDLVATNTCVKNPRGCFDGAVAVLLGTGKGKFKYFNSYPSGATGASLVVLGDVNGDGKLDILVAHWEAIGMLLGNGDGTFQPSQLVGPGGYKFTLADINADGKLDLVVVRFDGTVGLLGNGDGSFQAPVTYPAGDTVMGVAIADMNVDGKQDLVVVNDCFNDCDHGGVGVLLGNGDGTFQAPQMYYTGGMAPFEVTVADMNGDDKPDVAAINFNDSTVGVLLGNGDGTLQAVRIYDSGGGYPMGVVAADFNGDGKTDLAATHPCENYIYCDYSVVGILMGNGDGTFQAAQIFRTGGVSGIRSAVADLNADGMPDLAVANGSCTDVCSDEASVGVLINTTRGFLSSTTLTSNPNPSAYGQAVAYTATVASVGKNVPTGSVSFREGTKVLGAAKLIGGIAVLIRKYLPAGTHTITAVYNGDKRTQESSSSPITQVINVATSATTITSSLNPSVEGEPVTFTATVTSPSLKVVTGAVTFSEDARVLATVQLSDGQGTFTTSELPQGDHTITAAYDGNENINGSAASIVQVVN